MILTAVFCTFGALISSFSLPVDPGSFFWIWLICAIIVTTATVTYGGKGLLVLLIPVFSLLPINFSGVIDGGSWVIKEISRQFSLWLPVPVLFEKATYSGADTTLFIAAAGILLTLLLGFTICIRRSVFATIAVTAPIIFLTFVITNLQADVLYLLGVIAVYLSLLISSLMSPDNFKKRGLLTIPSFAIALVFMILAYMIAPHGEYAREEQIAALGNRFRVIASQMGRFGQFWQNNGAGAWDMGWLGRLDTGIWQFNTGRVSIADAGVRVPTHQSLLEITVNRPGTFYLRGYTMQSFDGRSWRNGETIPDELDGVARAMPAFIANLYTIHSPVGAPARAEMEITRTGDLTQRVTYQPYYSAVSSYDSDDTFFYIRNNVHSLVERMDGVDFSYTDTDGVLVSFPQNSSIYPIDIMRTYSTILSLSGVYTDVDRNTAHALRQLAIDAGIDPNADRAVIADAVARLIMSSGTYTLSPEVIPQDVDFALYFLQEQRQGYCIHFATAAVLMLRSLDVPARFTSGYVVTVAPGEVGRTVELTDMNAHAWAEVFYDEIGWLYLETTPSGGGTNIPAPRPHTPDAVGNEPETPEPAPSPDAGDNIPEEVEPEGVNNGAPTNGGTGSNENGITPQSDFEAPSWLQTAGVTVLCLVLILVALVVRRNIVKRSREKHFTQKDANKAIVYMWRYVTRLARREVIIQNDIEELALKARFSQHRMTEDERTVMSTYATKLATEVSNDKKWYARLWLKYIRAVC